jgi:hypothetical protein
LGEAGKAGYHHAHKRNAADDLLSDARRYPFEQTHHIKFSLGLFAVGLFAHALVPEFKTSKLMVGHRAFRSATWLVRWKSNVATGIIGSA